MRTKRILALLLVAALIGSMFLVAYAEGETEEVHEHPVVLAAEEVDQSVEFVEEEMEQPAVMAAAKAGQPAVLAEVGETIQEGIKDAAENIGNAVEGGIKDVVGGITGDITGSIIEGTTGIHVHSWKEVPFSNTATCTEAGTTKYVCVNVANLLQGKTCDATKTEVTPAKGHNISNWGAKTTPATCTEAAVKTGRCTSCFKTVSVTVGSPLGHKFGDWKAPADAVCNKRVTETRTCTVCGAEDTRTVLFGHAYGDWTVTKEATCTTAGSRTRTCANCKKTESEYIAKLGHDTITNTTKATCEKGGLEVVTCSRCDYRKETVLTATGHDLLLNGIGKEATCTEAGDKSGICKNCGKALTVHTEALGHDVKSVVTVPSCTEAGFIGKKCTRCDYIESGYETRPALGHDWVESADTATCTLPGVKTMTCSRVLLGCKEVLHVEGSPAKGHNVASWTVTKEPSCLAFGSKTGHCSNCDKDVTEAIAMTGHTWTSETIKKQPTCTEKGIMAAPKCTVCGYQALLDREIPALGHEWGKTVVTKAATCTVEGEGYHKCSNCDATENVKVPVDSSKHNYKYQITFASCNTEGRMGTFCTDCGHAKYALHIRIPATGTHRWKTTDGVTKCTKCGTVK